MKIPVYKLTLTLALTALTLVGQAQFKDQKVIDRSSKFSRTGQVSINAKHGNVQLISWDKDSIRVHVTINGESKSLSKLQEAMAKTTVGVDLKFTQANIQTLISETMISKGLSEIKELTGGGKIDISYKIYLPKQAKIMASNRYGDIYLDSHEGNVMLEVNHGNIRAHSIPELTMLRSTFGNVYIISAKRFTANLYFSELEIEECSSMTIDSKSTNFEIGTADELRFTSTNDDIVIDEVGKLHMTSNLTKVKVNEISKSCQANLKYGRFRAKKIGADVCELSFQTSRTTIDLGFDVNAQFLVSGIHEDVEFASSNPRSHIKTTEQGISGYYGNSGSSTCNYLFNGERSKIYFK